MTISTSEVPVPAATGLAVTEDALRVDLSDGRTLTVPLAWFPRLLHSTSAERNDWRLIGEGEGIHWPAVDGDISIESLIVGRPSTESASSLRDWLSRRSG